jgi:[ribosomal protein S18]-alanine N-acetyltransferase
MNGLAFNPVNEVSLPAIVAVVDRSFPADSSERWRPRDIAATLALSGSGALLVQDNADPIGFALWRSVLDETELLLLAVVPPWRRHGIGSRLLARLMDDLCAQDQTELFLEVRERNNPARALYNRHGFVIIGRRARYYLGSGGVFEDALTMRRSLGNGPTSR